MKKAVLLFLAIPLFMGCDKAKDPVNLNEGETITTLKLAFVEQGNSSNTFTVQYSDPDGIGGNPPTIDTLYLENGKTYLVNVEFWNESVNPAEDLTSEVSAESDEHLVCFEALSNFDVTIIKSDLDANSLPIGLSSTWTVNASQNGSCQISLKHQPDGAKDGTCIPGDTDVEVLFPVVVN